MLRRLLLTRRASTRSRPRATEYGWDIDHGDHAKIWRDGCIIRARLPRRYYEAYNKQSELPLLIADDIVCLQRRQRLRAAWREVVSSALHGFLHRLHSSLSYYDGVRADRLPLPSFRVSATTSDRTRTSAMDKEGTYHTEWSGDRSESRWS